MRFAQRLEDVDIATVPLMIMQTSPAPRHPTDLHFGEEPAEKDINSTIVQAVVLKAEKPDLVVMTGDMVSGYAWDHKEQGWFEKRWRS